MANLLAPMTALAISGPLDFANRPQVLHPGDDFLPQLEDSCDDGQNEDDSQSLFSVNSTPERRKGVTFSTAKRWLATWLISARMYHCHATLSPFSARLNEFAHILVPQCAFKNNDVLETIEFCLGMHHNTLCLHSRLFLMPLFMTIHRSLDLYFLLFLPSKPIIELVTKYLQDYLNKIRDREWRPWSKLRKGQLAGYEGLRDGTLYWYRLLPSPHFTSQLPIFVHGQQTLNVCFCPYKNLPEFSSHVTPFAVCVNALRALEDWEHPMTIQSVYRPRDVDYFMKLEKWTLMALLGLSKEDGTANTIIAAASQDQCEHATAFRRFIEVFHYLQVAYQTATALAPDNITQPPSRRNAGSPDPSQHSTTHGSLENNSSSPSPAPRNARFGLRQLGSKKTGGGSTKRVIGSILRCFHPTEADQVRDQYRASATVPTPLLSSRLLWQLRKS